MVAQGAAALFAASPGFAGRVFRGTPAGVTVPHGRPIRGSAQRVTRTQGSLRSPWATHVSPHTGRRGKLPGFVLAHGGPKGPACRQADPSGPCYSAKQYFAAKHELGLPRAAPRPAGEAAAECYAHLNEAEVSVISAALR